MEREILLAIHQIANPLLDALFTFTDHAFDVAPMTVLVLIVGANRFVAKDSRAGFMWLGAGVWTAILIPTLKGLFNRDRPELWETLVEPSLQSFPSGHSFAASAIFPLLAFQVVQWRPKWRKPAFAIGIAMPLLIGFGRLYLGVHWPTDVLAGWAIGGFTAWGAARWFSLKPTAPKIDSSKAVEG